MKIKATQAELKECLTNAFKRIVNEGKTNKKDGFNKAFKSANREIERDTYGDGFKAYDKVHKSSKDYSRKGKNRFRFNDELDEAVIDLSSPEDNGYYDDGYEIEAPDIEDIIGGKEYRGERQSVNRNSNEEVVTIRTDIDPIEGEFIDRILDKFEDAEYDIDGGDICFNIGKSRAKKLISYLEQEDVEIK